MSKTIKGVLISIVVSIGVLIGCIVFFENNYAKSDWICISSADNCFCSSLPLDVKAGIVDLETGQAFGIVKESGDSKTLVTGSNGVSMHITRNRTISTISVTGASLEQISNAKDVICSKCLKELDINGEETLGRFAIIDPTKDNLKMVGNLSSCYVGDYYFHFYHGLNTEDVIIAYAPENP